MDAMEAIGQFASKQQTVGELKAKQEALEGRFDRFEESYRDNLKRIYEKLDRPSWMTAGLITFLSSACVALLTIVLTRGN